MIRFIQTGEERGDCTAPYSIDFGGENYTVRSFIDEILKKHERDWGTFGIYVPRKDRKQFSDHFGNPTCEYSCGKLKTVFPEYILEKNVVGASADGGWTRMDYIIMVEGQEEE